MPATGSMAVMVLVIFSSMSSASTCTSRAFMEPAGSWISIRVGPVAMVLSSWPTERATPRGLEGLVASEQAASAGTPAMATAARKRVKRRIGHSWAVEG
ncbi:MAG: hypothetical protein IPK12_03265 [Gemmatimonadetes bacterium]|nr:hypothetical protein [Gemmatimonadota bacterium]